MVGVDATIVADTRVIAEDATDRLKRTALSGLHPSLGRAFLYLSIYSSIYLRLYLGRGPCEYFAWSPTGQRTEQRDGSGIVY